MNKHLLLCHKLLFSSNNKRSNLLKKNIILSVALSAINVLISFLMYPLLIDYLGANLYGTWLTIASLSTWMLFFEFGLGSGLKNQLAKALAHNDCKLGKELVSTTYFFVVVIALFVFLVYFALRPLIDWNELLDSSLQSSILSSFVTIMICSFCCILVLKLVGNIASAIQNPYIEKVINTTTQILLLLVVFFLSKLATGDIVKLSIYWTSITVLIWIISSIILFLTKFKKIRPEISTIRIAHIRLLLSLGIQFFLIQLSLVVIHGSTNFIISHNIGSEQVVVYNAAYKLFSIANILYAIVIAPTWAAFIEAIEQDDILWIKSIIKKMLSVWGIITVGMFVILLFSPIIYKIWLGDRVQIPFALSATLFLYFSTMTFGGVFNMFINATGKLKTQLVCWVVTALVYIPIVLLLIKNTNLGIYAVALSLLLSNTYYIIFAPMGYKKFINNHGK